MKDNEKQIKEMASDMDYACIKHDLWPEDAKEIAKVLTILGYQKVGEDKVILTKDEFRSMIKTDTEAEEYGQQCWNDGRAQGVREFADFIISNMRERDYMGIKYRQGIFSECEIDEFVNQFNDRYKEN